MVSPTRPKPPTILLTGFNAFGGDPINPSWLAALQLHGKQIARHKVFSAQLPTEFDRSLTELRALMRMHRPALVVCLGLAGGRAALSLERVALNINDARMADNAGAQPIDTPVVATGPTAYFARLPIKAMMDAMTREGVAAEVSQTAGTFVCNHVFYGLLHTLATARGFQSVLGGFIHVPWLPEQGVPSMSLNDSVRGVRAALHCALTTPVDKVLSAGALH